MSRMAFEVHRNFGKRPATAIDSMAQPHRPAEAALRSFSTPVFFFAVITLAYALLSQWR